MNKKAFTLIEMIVGITISIILMVSVGIFVNNGMANIFTQQKILKNTEKLTDFTNNIQTSINLMSSGTTFPTKTLSGIIFKRNKNLGEGGFTYIGEVLSSDDADGNGIYCESGSEDTATKHIIIKHFIPFEEETDNIFSNYDNALKSTITTGYQTLQKENKVILFSSKDTIIGKGFFGSKITEGDSGKNVYLNSPTGIEKVGDILFISDTLNNRVLYYKIVEDETYTLLDESDGLNEPTGLYYNSTDKALYIANSGNGEILKYSSKSDTDKTINIDTNINKDINNIKKVDIEFYPGIINITEPNDITDLDFNSTITTTVDYFTGTTNKITYWFSNFLDNFQTQDNQPCSGAYIKFYESSGDIIKETIASCSGGTGTIRKYKTNQTIDRHDGHNIKITTGSDTSGSDFTNTGTYYMKLDLVGDETYTEYIKLFTKSDNNILTPDDNKLEVYISGLNYPTGIWSTDGITIEYNEFGNRTFNNKIFDYNSSDIILESPINYLDIYMDDSLITFFLRYYKKYNCYNLDDNSKRTYLFKKNLK